MTYHFHTDQYQDACALVEKFHYSRRTPKNVQIVGTMHTSGGLFGDHGECVAACFFSVPGTRWGEDVLELSRLVRTETHLPLTGLISATSKALKAKGFDLLVSFADSTQGHHGGIYQAASWNYDGKRNRAMDGLVVDGVFVPGRACNHRFGTRSPAKVAVIIGREVFPHYDEGKHLYWRALGPKGKAKAGRLGLRSAAYPKPVTP